MAEIRELAGESSSRENYAGAVNSFGTEDFEVLGDVLGITRMLWGFLALGDLMGSFGE